MDTLNQPFIYQMDAMKPTSKKHENLDVFFPTIKFVEFSRVNCISNLYVLHPVALTLITTVDDVLFHKKWLAGLINDMKKYRMERMLDDQKLKQDAFSELSCSVAKFRNLGF